ncbi:MAG: hypothetical protein NZ959_04185 [Armatimonadetes bacterium]|nr:hypothetical protein [Armatimonadota bacterium]MDW8121441.1 hypothetical protein [Armatimonadota bacterium]
MPWELATSSIGWVRLGRHRWRMEQQHRAPCSTLPGLSELTDRSFGKLL